MGGLEQTRTVALASGGAMPVVGLGTWQLRGQRGYEAIRHALEAGYRHIDTATMYGNEADVGRALRDSGVDRAEVFVTTKLPPGNAGRERETLTASLRALGTEYVDLWLVHWPPRSTAAPKTWQAFLAAQEQGLVKAVGVSNYRVDQIDELIEETGQAPVVNQIPFSPSRFDAKLLADHSERRVVVEGYSPLKDTDLGSRVLAGIASRHGVSPAQVVLRWYVERAIPVIPRSVNPQRITANLDVFGFSLDADEVASVDRMSA